MIQKIEINRIVPRKEDVNYKNVCKVARRLEKGEFIDVIQVVPFADVFYIIDGEIRFRALQKLGYKEIACEVLHQQSPRK